MNKILVITASELIGIPAILSLKQQDLLAAVAVPDKASKYLLPTLNSLEISNERIHVLTKQGLAAELKNLLEIYTPAAVFVFTLSWRLSDEVLDLLPGRFINFHIGLLPKYKGADPIFWQIRNGEKNCGLTVHLMTADVDAGPIVFKQQLPLYPGETHGYNTVRLGALVAEAAVKVALLLNQGDLSVTEMPAETALYFKKPSQVQLTINWQQQSALEIENLVNAANPCYQGALTTIRQMQIRVLEVTGTEVNNPENHEFMPGTIVHADLQYGLIVACCDKKFLKVNVACIKEGFFSGSKLFALGFKAGEVFV